MRSATFNSPPQAPHFDAAMAASTTTAPENAGEEAWVYHFPPIGSLHSMGPLHPPPGIYAKRSSPPIPLGGRDIHRTTHASTRHDTASSAANVST
jgi:hypothetical protein